MATVRFTPALRRFFPGLKEESIEKANVADLLLELDERYKGIRDYVVNDDGSLRKHVNIFIENEMIHDRTQLSDKLEQNSKVYIMQALSGG